MTKQYYKVELPEERRPNYDEIFDCDDENQYNISLAHFNQEIVRVLRDVAKGQCVPINADAYRDFEQNRLRKDYQSNINTVYFCVDENNALQSFITMSGGRCKNQRATLFCGYNKIKVALPSDSPVLSSTSDNDTSDEDEKSDAPSFSKNTYHY